MSAVEIDLRQPSMLHGKKGFERIVWAFKNVLNQSMTWLFYDFEMKESSESSVPSGKRVVEREVADGGAEQINEPIARHHPVQKLVSPQKVTINAVLLPDLDPADGMNSKGDFEDWALDVYEWLSLVGIQSPRATAGDSIDPYLSRYRIPRLSDDSGPPKNLILLSWSSLLPARWIRSLFIQLR